ncbi:MAG: hypothetical protein ABFD54_07275 [Armatimonadota bacterium]
MMCFIIADKSSADHMDIAPFARVVTCDPDRLDGARSGRLEEFRAEDVFLETEILQSRNKEYILPPANGKCCIGLQWPERRNLSRLSLQFRNTESIPPKSSVQVQYWSSEGRVDDWATIGQTLWQGKWAALPGDLNIKGKDLVLNIDGDVSEFKTGFGVQKIRWIISGVSGPVSVQKLSAYTVAQSSENRFRVQLDRRLEGKRAEVEVYNGYILDSAGRTASTKCHWDLASPLNLNLRFTTTPRLPDRTIIRFKLPDAAFGISVEDIVSHGCVYVPSSGLFATTEDSKTSIADYKKSIAGKKTVLERVRIMPDQTFEHAKAKLFNPTSNRDPILLSLACDNRKIIAQRDGSTEFDIVPDTVEPLKYPYVMFRRFGSGKEEGLTRHLEDRWLPVPVATLRDNGITYTQRTFVAPLDKTQSGAAAKWIYGKPVGVVQFLLENIGNEATDASLLLSFIQRTYKPNSMEILKGEPLTTLRGVDNGALVIKDGVLFAYIEINDTSALQPSLRNNDFTLQGKLPAHATAQCNVYFPKFDIKPDEYATLTGADDLLQTTKTYWRRMLSSAMKINVPEPVINDIFAANQVHILLASRNEQDGALIQPWCGAGLYGPLDTETQPVILAMDLLGHHEFARRSLDYFLSRYNSMGCLANGYTLMGTGQNLWTIGEHYWLTRDEEWLNSIVPKLVKSCRWISDQRKKTMRLDPLGGKLPEYGLAPPGVLADWNRYSYYFYANGYYFAGMNAVANMLADIGYPQSSSLVKEARAYREDILRAYRWNQSRMPVLPLSNETWVPAYPSSMYCFGLTKDFYQGVSSVGHDVEVGANHLLELGVLEPKSNDGDWITNYMEDAWFFLSPGLANYSSDEMQKDWFTYGGFSKLQPYYTRYSDVLALRDDVKPFVRNYFNTMFPMLSLESLALWEHFNTAGAYNKTHETAWMLEQTRTMLLMERGDQLWIAPFATNNWMKNGMVVSVEDAPSKFGNISYKITSKVSCGYIEAEIHLPAGNTVKELVIRVRHPEEKRMRVVEVNNERHTDFYPSRECIRIKNPSSKMMVKISY